MASNIEARIRELARERRAVILAHNYQVAAVQDLADFVGDSLELSATAAKTDAKVIVFCGVLFMAETAKILSPDKTVLVPDRNAGCPLANMLTARELRALKAEHPDALVLCYVNSSADVKAESDICVTSGNAERVVAALPAGRPVIFVPDQSLGDYTSRKTGRPLILWNGYCPTHHRILAEHVLAARRAHPEAKVVVHPECTRDVIALADEVASTSGILRYCRSSDARAFIIGTESGLLHRLRRENAGKAFYQASPFSDCPNMRLTTPEKVLWSLEDMQCEVSVPEESARRAKRALDRMLEYA
ncbi:MAG: quinolinate synthase NadA [Planctomycetota bacterium]